VWNPLLWSILGVNWVSRMYRLKYLPDLKFSDILVRAMFIPEELYGIYQSVQRDYSYWLAFTHAPKYGMKPKEKWTYNTQIPKPREKYIRSPNNPRPRRRLAFSRHHRRSWTLRRSSLCYVPLHTCPICFFDH
jgi:hypothetical protein